MHRNAAPGISGKQLIIELNSSMRHMIVTFDFFTISNYSRKHLMLILFFFKKVNQMQKMAAVMLNWVLQYKWT